MQLPSELQEAIDRVMENFSSTTLQQASTSLTKIYQEGGHSASIFSDPAKKLAYLSARMPATYAAARAVLEQLSLPCDHFFDLGAGPGTASWAAADLFPSLQTITLIERSPEAIALGKTLAASSSHPALQQAHWVQQSLTEQLNINVPDRSVALLAYVLNELEEPHALIERCWETFSLLILIEPGTPRGFHLMRTVREQLLDLKAHLLAPCPHALSCPIQGSDWCHFSARVERGRLHRLVKKGALGYEDEKFSYLIASKHPAPLPCHRIVRHPLKNSGHVRLSLCTNQGRLEEKVIAKREKDSYRSARHARWGDTWPSL